MFSRPAMVLFGITLVIGGLTIVTTGDVRTLSNQEGYEPVQPIAFSHRLHAGEMGIDCAFCHTGTLRSRHAGLPATETCYGCHRFIQASSNDVRAEREMAKKEGRAERVVVSPEIRKIYGALALDENLEPDSARRARPIEWIKVHNVGDFVFFDHHKHINGGVECGRCHGPVETMERIRQTVDMNMGWCISCHRKENLAFNTDVTMQKYVEEKAGIDCAKCHY